MCRSWSACCFPVLCDVSNPEIFQHAALATCPRLVPFQRVAHWLPAARAGRLPQLPQLPPPPIPSGLTLNPVQGVALLPFIDEDRLLTATAAQEPKLTEEEAWRNSQRLALLFCHCEHPLVWPTPTQHLPGPQRCSLSCPTPPYSPHRTPRGPVPAARAATAAALTASLRSGAVIVGRCSGRMLFEGWFH